MSQGVYRELESELEGELEGELINHPVVGSLIKAS